MKLTKVASYPPEPEPKIPERLEKMDDHHDYISYKGRFFSVPTNHLIYLENLPTNIEYANKLAQERGMMNMTKTGEFRCGYCQYNENNAFKQAMENGVGIFNQEGTPGIAVKGCTYDNRELKHASRFKGPNGTISRGV